MPAPEYHVRQGGWRHVSSRPGRPLERPCCVGRSVQQRRVSGSMGLVVGGKMTGGTEPFCFTAGQPWLASSVGQSVSEEQSQCQGQCCQRSLARPQPLPTHRHGAGLCPLSPLDDVPCAGGDTRPALLTDSATLVSIHCFAADEDPQRHAQHMERGRKALRRLTGKERTATAKSRGGRASEERSQHADGVCLDGGLASRRAGFTSPFALR